MIERQNAFDFEFILTGSLGDGQETVAAAPSSLALRVGAVSQLAAKCHSRPCTFTKNNTFD